MQTTYQWVASRLPGGLAQLVGITQSYLSLLERGKRTIDAAMLEKLAKALECDTSDLLNEKRRLA